jgi:DNA-binding CsgD family transcriptional regulator
MTTNPDYWTIAERVCTQRQLDALHLHDRGLSNVTISLHLGVSPERVRALIRRATQKINLELDKEPA